MDVDAVTSQPPKVELRGLGVSRSCGGDCRRVALDAMDVRHGAKLEFVHYRVDDGLTDDVLGLRLDRIRSGFFGWCILLALAATWWAVRSRCVPDRSYSGSSDVGPAATC